ncbi:MAG: histidine kinase [Rubritepida sp.]|nr:histidine kinase [Rubritepida sp.]
METSMSANGSCILGFKDQGTATSAGGSSSRRVGGAGRASASSRAEQRLAVLESENAALRTESERLRRLLDTDLDFAIVTLDLEGRVTGWNGGAGAILGYQEAEILGRSAEVFFLPEDRAEGAFVRELCRALEDGRAPNERWHVRRDGSRFWASGAMLPLLGKDGQLEGFLNVFRDNSGTQAEEERRALLFAEMGHRIKNTLATVQAVAAQTLRTAEVPREVQSAFDDRIAALARSHDLLLRGRGEGALLAEVVERALSPYCGADRAELGGPPVKLPAELVEVFGLAFHELGTNAAKHGALSVPVGRIEVRWALRRVVGGPPSIDIVWRESGGPPVVPPASRGFGSQLLERGLTHTSGGSVKMHFRPEGLECQISLPIMTGTDRN